MTGQAFWHTGTSGPTSGETYPRSFSLLADTPPVAQVNWTTVDFVSPSPLGYRRVSSGAQNASVEWDVVMDSGTWAFSMLHQRGTGRGIYSVRLDGTEIGTIDAYAGSDTNARTQLTGITVASAGVKRLALVMATKSGSSGGYYGSFSAISAARTGA